jgi:hypothetical protein
MEEQCLNGKLIEQPLELWLGKMQKIIVLV